MVKRAALALSRIALLIAILVALILSASPIQAANPVIVTDVATDVTESTANLNSQITDLGTFAGPNVYLFFEYCTDAYYDAYLGAYEKKTSETTWPIASGLTTYTVSISGLAKSTEYHYRAALRYGTAYVYGLDQTFNTTMVYPDRTPEIYTLKAYKNLLEANDVLLVILADIPYNDVPAIPISRAYTWSLMDTGTEKGWNVGYAMNDNGYNLNVFSLYFPASTGLTWGSTTKYNVQLTGNPAVFSGIVPVYDSVDSGDYAVTADTWLTSSDYSATLTADLLAVASTLEQDWQVVLLDEQDTKTVLSSNGEKLFRNAIPGVQSMAPALFYVQNAETQTGKRTWGTSLDDLYKGRLLGADKIAGTADDTWIAKSLTPLADWLNIPFGLLIGVICLGCCVFVVKKSNERYATNLPGYVASLLIIICFSMLALGLVLAAVIGMAIVIGASYLMFLRRA